VKITNLQIQNVKKLRAIEIKADQHGNLIIISGENDQGKSSILDSISYAIEGKKAFENTKSPIREGTDLKKEKAQIRIETEKFIITRHWTGNETSKSYLKVVANDEYKAEYPSPQALLDGIKGDIGFDPVAFQMLGKTKLGRMEQMDILLSLAKFEVDPRKIDQDIELIKDERRMINREHTKLKAIITELPDPEDNLPNEKISVMELIQKKDEANAKNVWNKEQREKVQKFEEDLNEKVKTANNLQSQIEVLQEQQEKYLIDIKEDNQKLSTAVGKMELLEDIDLDDYLVLISEAEKVNAKIQARDNRSEIENEAGDLFVKAEAETEKIKKLEAQKEQLLKDANLPVKGLGFSDEGIIYKKLPLAQASDSEQFRVAMAITMAKNPELRVIVSKSGGLLDKNKVVLITKMCKDKDYQLWLERVDEKELSAIIIEDGKIKEGGTGSGTDETSDQV